MGSDTFSLECSVFEVFRRGWGGRHFQFRVLYFWGILKSEADSFSVEK